MTSFLSRAKMKKNKAAVPQVTMAGQNKIPSLASLSHPLRHSPPPRAVTPMIAILRRGVEERGGRKKPRQEKKHVP